MGSKGLIIVESPTKAKTIKRFLSGDYEVIASVGHVKDLPKSELGVDPDADFEPTFTIIRGKGKVLKEMKAKAKSVDAVFLASDPDREGEAISWHIAQELKGANANIYRVMFHEITSKAVKASLAHPGELSGDIYQSQLSRRILDRLVGYKISPVLWRSVARGLSAGRVQSVAVRLVVERERAIEAFVPREYWVISAVLQKDNKDTVEAKVVKIGSKKLEISTGDKAETIVDELKNLPVIVSKVETKQRKRVPPPPFITSSLQQDAWRVYRLPAAITMRIAQRLYEGMDVHGQGAVGLITYMRTDSVRVSNDAVAQARANIVENFGKDYLPAKPRIYKNKRNAQDAHEAIRPTGIERTPQVVKGALSPEEFKVYSLIYNRFLASQMACALFENTSVDFVAGRFGLKASGTVLVKDGFLRVYKTPFSEDSQRLPNLKKADKLDVLKVNSVQKFTQPPARYTDASLIKELEERGIGRPSTYATIVTTIRDRGYCEKQEGKFRATELGRLVNDVLVGLFPHILDYDFTAKMENDLDLVEEGKKTRISLLREFWSGFEPILTEAVEKARDLKTKVSETSMKCEHCGKPMSIKWGRGGAFLACTGYPECKNTQNFTRDKDGRIVLEEKEDVGECPKCEKPLVVKSGRFGRFIACTGYPECDYRAPYVLPFRCPEEGCNGHLVERMSAKRKKYYTCNQYPDCKFSSFYEPVDKACPSCGAPTLFKRTGRNARLMCVRKDCNYSEALKKKATAD